LPRVTAESDLGYFATPRPDIVAELPRPLGRVLDVGCGAGGTSGGLRAAGAEAVVGIEIDARAAAEARKALDRVVEAPVERALDEDLGTFDTVLCLDVLEHLVDPLGVLERLRAISNPGAFLFVSVPNARHFSLIRDLVVRGTFGYGDWGHRDRTHLRWFTPRDARALVADAGWDVVGVGWPPLGRSRALHRLTRGRSSEFLVGQVYVQARNPA
jgi:2-polyprenyl-3-methyl-5-hydroxy-6-metoxy-1,4-benzoquinol methylase